MLPELDSWSGEGLSFVLECKQFANVQSSGTAMGKDCTLELEMQLEESLRSRNPCPCEEEEKPVGPGLESLAELLGQSLPSAAPLGNEDRTLRERTTMPPTQEHHSSGDSQKKKRQMQLMHCFLDQFQTEELEQVWMFPPHTGLDHTVDDAESQGSHHHQQQRPTAKEMPWA